MPESAQGETTEKPTPMPEANRINVIANEVVLPAKMAFQLTAEEVSTNERSVVSVTLVLASEPACDIPRVANPNQKGGHRCDDGAVSSAALEKVFDQFGGDPLPYGLTDLNRSVIQRLTGFSAIRS